MKDTITWEAGSIETAPSQGRGTRDPSSDALGERVRALREGSGLTLDELSRRSGVSRAMLSKVERGEKSPTIGIASRIARSLSTTLTFLTGGTEDRHAVVLVRERDRHIFRDPETGFERHILSPPIAGSAVELLYHYLPAGASTGTLPPYPAGTEKQIVVTEGGLIVSIGVTETIMNQGDSIFFEADVEHSFNNPAEKPCGYYLVISRHKR